MSNKDLSQGVLRWFSGSVKPCAWTWIEEHRDSEGRPITFGHRVFSEAPPFDGGRASRLTALYSYDQLIYALSAYGEFEKQKWQPIETAPKDEMILVLWDGKYIATAVLEDDGYERVWYEHGEEAFDGIPTHWMPSLKLPESSEV